MPEPGIWRVELAFRDRGMYHMRIRSDSGSLEYGDVPMLPMYAATALPEEPNESPGLSVAFLLAALGLLALGRRR